MDKTLIRLIEKAQKKYEQGLQRGWLPDDVHDYRVAIRKARATLKFWHSESSALHKRIGMRLRILQRQTALVREWDVFVERFGEVIDEKAVEKGRFGRFLLIQDLKQVGIFWEECHADALKMKGEPSNQREGKLLQRIFRESEAEYVDWHRLRIQIKGYRYTLEGKAKVDQELVALLIEWQDRLGLIQDGYTNRKWFEWLEEGETMVHDANEELLASNMKDAEKRLPNLIEILQRQHP